MKRRLLLGVGIASLLSLLLGLLSLLLGLLLRIVPIFDTPKNYYDYLKKQNSMTTYKVGQQFKGDNRTLEIVGVKNNRYAIYIPERDTYEWFTYDDFEKFHWTPQEEEQQILLEGSYICPKCRQLTTVYYPDNTTRCCDVVAFTVNYSPVEDKPSEIEEMSNKNGSDVLEQINKHIEEAFDKRFVAINEPDKNLLEAIKGFLFQLLEEQQKAIKAELREKLRMELKIEKVIGDELEDYYIAQGWNSAVREHNRLLSEVLGGEDELS